jgi:hypothetical protein
VLLTKSSTALFAAFAETDISENSEVIFGSWQSQVQVGRVGVWRDEWVGAQRQGREANKYNTKRKKRETKKESKDKEPDMEENKEQRDGFDPAQPLIRASRTTNLTVLSPRCKY